MLAESANRANVAFRDVVVENVPVRGVSSDYRSVQRYSDVERGRLISRLEVDRARPVTVLGWETADKLFGPVAPVDKR